MTVEVTCQYLLWEKSGLMTVVKVCPWFVYTLTRKSCQSILLCKHLALCSKTWNLLALDITYSLAIVLFWEFFFESLYAQIKLEANNKTFKDIHMTAMINSSVVRDFIVLLELIDDMSY